jgi:hypothetical protein
MQQDFWLFLLLMLQKRDKQSYVDWIHRLLLFHKGTSKNRTFLEKLRAKNMEFSLRIFHIFEFFEVPPNGSNQRR